LKGLSLKRG